VEFALASSGAPKIPLPKSANKLLHKGRDCNRQTRSLPGAVLTKGTGFEFGDLGFFQDDSDL
jgi:hypothetical protein